MNLQTLLNESILDNPVQNYLVLAGILLVLFIFRHLISRFIISLFRTAVKHWAPEISIKKFLELLQKPLEFFILMSVLFAATDHFNFPTRINILLFHSSLEHVSAGILQILYIISVFWILLRLVDFVSMVISDKANLSHPSDSQVVIFFRDFIKVIVGIIGLVVMMELIIGHDAVNKIIGALGIGAAAVALAAKESIENLIGSFIILFDKPFRVGDYVQLNSVAGNVERIGLRSTRLRTDQKTYLTVPNKQMVDSILDNQSLRTQRDGQLRLEIASDTPADTLLDMVKQIGELLKNNPGVEKNYTVSLIDISRNAYVIKLTYFTFILEWNAFCALKEQVILDIIRLFETRKVSLARFVDILPEIKTTD